MNRKIVYTALVLSVILGVSGCGFGKSSTASTESTEASTEGITENSIDDVIDEPQIEQNSLMYDTDKLYINLDSSTASGCSFTITNKTDTDLTLGDIFVFVNGYQAGFDQSNPVVSAKSTQTVNYRYDAQLLKVIGDVTNNPTITISALAYTFDKDSNSVISIDTITGTTSDQFTPSFSNTGEQVYSNSDMTVYPFVNTELGSAIEIVNNTDKTISISNVLDHNVINDNTDSYSPDSFSANESSAVGINIAPRCMGFFVPSSMEFIDTENYNSPDGSDALTDVKSDKLQLRYMFLEDKNYKYYVTDIFDAITKEVISGTEVKNEGNHIDKFAACNTTEVDVNNALEPTGIAGDAQSVVELGAMPMPATDESEATTETTEEATTETTEPAILKDSPKEKEKVEDSSTLSTEDAEEKVDIVDSSKAVVIDIPNFKASMQDAYINADGNLIIDVTYRNTSRDDIDVHISSVNINNICIPSGGNYGYSVYSTHSGSECTSSIVVDKEDLKTNGISDINKISITYRLHDTTADTQKVTTAMPEYWATIDPVEIYASGNTGLDVDPLEIPDKLYSGQGIDVAAKIKDDKTYSVYITNTSNATLTVSLEEEPSLISFVNDSMAIIDQDNPWTNSLAKSEARLQPGCTVVFSQDLNGVNVVDSKYAVLQDIKVVNASNAGEINHLLRTGSIVLEIVR